MMISALFGLRLTLELFLVIVVIFNTIRRRPSNAETCRRSFSRFGHVAIIHAKLILRPLQTTAS